MAVNLYAFLEARARRYPAAVAVEDLAVGQAWTWADWHRAADRTASQLVAAGVGPGDRVALLLPHSMDFLGALLACWRVGAVAVPLDPASPASEMAGFLVHARAALVLVANAQVDRVDAVDSVGVLDVAGERLVRAACSVEPPSAPGDALLLYTSGSTGNPKAVRLTHRNVSSSLHALCAALHLGRRTRVLSTLSLFASHGLFVHGLAPLVHGGTLVRAPLPGPFNARTFWRQAAAARANFFSTVPQVLSLLLSMAEGRPPGHLRVFSASAPLALEVAAACADRFGVPVRNAFGMSEAASWFLYGAGEGVGDAGGAFGADAGGDAADPLADGGQDEAACVGEDANSLADGGQEVAACVGDDANSFADGGQDEAAFGWDAVEPLRDGGPHEADPVTGPRAGTVGRPTRCHVRLGPPSAPWPANGVGELLIRGSQVTPGYWNNDAANAAAFEQGWLHTGDVMRVDAAGWHYCVGRVKRAIHRAGRTVYPEDVEAVLAAFPGVAEAAVVGASHEVYGEVPRAFVVPCDGISLDPAALHRHLRDRLAAFRLPRYLDVVDALPHLPGGKTDLEKLARRPLSGG